MAPFNHDALLERARQIVGKEIEELPNDANMGNDYARECIAKIRHDIVLSRLYLQAIAEMQSSFLGSTLAIGIIVVLMLVYIAYRLS